MSGIFESIIGRSYKLATDRSHDLVTLEHLLGALLEDKDIQELIIKSHGDLESLTKDNLEWLDNKSNHVIVRNTQYQPRHTTLLGNVVKKAKTQSMFSGKQEVMPVDLLIAIYGIADSPASYFLDKYTSGKESMITYLTRSNISDNDIIPAKDAEEILRTFCVNINDKAKLGKIDPLIGREKEVEQITQILARRNKHNVIMVGEPGVGKTNIIEGLARKIAEKDVPEILLNKTIWSLDIATMVAGTRFRGDFEERMKQVLKALKSLPNAIAFIDEIHMIMGAGNGTGGGALDAANILKPALSRGEIYCIGSTTLEEYRRHFEKDRALIRRFQKINIEEPSIEDSKRILRGIAKYYEKYHNITFESSALDLAVELTHKHMHDKFLPDKAIDVIDSAAAWQRIRPDDIRLKIITEEEIEQEVSRIAKIPPKTVKTTDIDKLSNLDSDLKEVVFGQNEAIANLVNSIYMSRSGLREEEKTLGNYVFAGASGVGKTESAKQLALTLGIKFIRFDMSEYQEKHTVSRLIGAPPGYVGFGDGAAGQGLLTNEIDNNPHCVLLLDEIEKAHPDIFNIFLQVMDYGKLTNSNGKVINFRNVLIIYTTNLGSADMERESIGFGNGITDRDDDTQAINKFFSPEFRNRLDAIIKFNKLTKDNMNKILDKFIKQLNELSYKKNVKIIFNDASKDWLVNKGFDAKMGARPLAKVIANNIKLPISKEILFGKLKNGGAVMVSVKDNNLEFEYLSNTSNVAQDNLISDTNNMLPIKVNV